MFTFFSRMYDENPTFLSVMCGSTVLLWIYFVFSDFLPDFSTEDNRFDITLPQTHKKKPKSSKILEESLCKRIAWINVPIECNRFSTHFAEHFVVHAAPLTWNGFANKPIRMQFENTGNDARMTAMYEIGNIPFISSDEIGAKFSFKTIRFLCNHRASNIQQPIEKCSSNSSGGGYGSMVDRTIAMEMQLLAETENHSMPIRFLIFSWFFHVVGNDKSKNYSLEPLIKCLKFIRRPNTMKTIKKPFPLDRIVYESAGNYYGYTSNNNSSGKNGATKLHDSTNESYHQLIEANHLIPIGITQMREFHKLAHHIE